MLATTWFPNPSRGAARPAFTPTQATLRTHRHVVNIGDHEMESWSSVSIPGLRGAHQLNHCLALCLGFSDCKMMASIFALYTYLIESSSRITMPCTCLGLSGGARAAE